MNIVLDEDETNAMKLPPKFTLFPKVKLEEILIQKQVCDTKCRWDRMERLIDDNGDIIIEEGDEVYKDDEEVVEENRHVEVYDPIRKVFDYTKIKATKIKSNPRVIMPGSRPAKEEAQMTARTAMIESVVKEV